jgi:hypothetical protein
VLRKKLKYIECIRMRNIKIKQHNVETVKIEIMIKVFDNTIIDKKNNNNQFDNFLKKILK